MTTVGIICEYDPMHLGHQRQLNTIRTLVGADCGIVCLMSGSFVQRGKPAIVHKSLRAEAAVRCGADLVLELPVTASLSSAEGFAAKGVAILGSFCDSLCFGAETADRNLLMSTAHNLLSDAFPPALRAELDKGLSFPAARAAALDAMGADSRILSTPNNILGIEYCKAIISQGCAMEPMPIKRGGSYHAQTPDAQEPSATAVRALMLGGQNPSPYLPAPAWELFRDARLHSLAAGERAILTRLRTMTDAEFESLPYGSEGLWRKLMHAARTHTTLEEIATAVKTKRYTRSRIDRMMMCAFLGLTAQDMAAPIPYARVLAFNDKGRLILKAARETGIFPNIGEKLDHPYQQIENRAAALYGLFALDRPEPPADTSRVRYVK